MKPIVWTLLAAVVSAGAAALAMRALTAAWRRTTHEDPPDQPAWARLILGMPAKKGIQKVAEA